MTRVIPVSARLWRSCRSGVIYRYYVHVPAPPCAAVAKQVTGYVANIRKLGPNADPFGFSDALLRTLVGSNCSPAQKEQLQLRLYGAAKAFQKSRKAGNSQLQ